MLTSDGLVFRVVQGFIIGTSVGIMIQSGLGLFASSLFGSLVGLGVQYIASALLPEQR